MTPNQRYTLILVSVIGVFVLVLVFMCCGFVAVTSMDTRNNYNRNHPPVQTSTPAGWK